jgi:hypothetical protein
MCACEPSFTCSKCRDTSADPRYLLDEPEQPEPEPLVRELERG